MPGELNGDLLPVLENPPEKDTIATEGAIRTFSSLKSALDEGFHIYGRNSERNIYLARKRKENGAGWELAIVECLHGR